jgi:hypothetical protein
MPILLLGTDSQTPVWSETADMSADGFYCTTAQPFSPGEKLECLIALPSQPLGPSRRNQLYLKGQVDVIRLVLNNNTGFGIGCRICHYRLVASPAIPSWAATAGFESSDPAHYTDTLVPEAC